MLNVIINQESVDQNHNEILSTRMVITIIKNTHNKFW